MLAWVLSKSQNITSVGENVEKGEHLCTVSGNINWYRHDGKRYGGSLEIKNRTPYNPSIPILDMYPRK